MNWFLLLLWNFLSPGVDADPEPDADPEADPEPDVDPDADPEADPEPDADPNPDADPEPDEEPPAPRETRAQKAIRETRERAQKAETDLATVRAELEAARRPPAQPAQPSEEQVLWQQEEEVLRNPEAQDWQKYAIRSAREARQARTESRSAMQRADDMADRAKFAELAVSKPALYTQYKDKVETRLAEARKAGSNPSRESVLAFIVGQDVIAGNLKSGEGKPKKPGGTPRPAAPRSDVPATRGGSLSEAERREKRLENIRI